MWCFRESLVDTDVCRLTSLKDKVSNIKRVAHFGNSKINSFDMCLEKSTDKYEKIKDF